MGIYFLKKWLRRLPSNKPDCIQHFLKAPSGAARAQVVPPQFFAEFFVAVNDPAAALDLGLRGEASAALTAARERNAD